MDDEHTDWEARFAEEIRQAETARAAGNEGMARVCARRAAGIAIGEYLQRRGLPDPGPNAYNRIQRLASLREVAPEVSRVASHLLARVTP
ncbi:MAG: hypothetical protein L0Z70_15010, partial [Chloroflexi bacterium]|nr:hypothetical protein [Chloroflexota bacterium]